MKAGYQLEGGQLKHRPEKTIRADLDAHLAKRPPSTDIRRLTAWALRKEALQTELAIATGSGVPKWTEVPGRKGKVAA